MSTISTDSGLSSLVLVTIKPPPELNEIKKPSTQNDNSDTMTDSEWLAFTERLKAIWNRVEEDSPKPADSSALEVIVHKLPTNEQKGLPESTLSSFADITEPPFQDEDLA
jgi:hypothetical protein